MKKFSEIDFGYNDAVNYLNSREHKEMFSSVFVKGKNLDNLMRPDTYFLIGDKGTGKTAYAVFLTNNDYRNTKAQIVSIASTDYSVFAHMKEKGLYEISDYTRIWKIILLVILTTMIDGKYIDEFGPLKTRKLQKLKDSINKYYNDAFIPEVLTTIKYVDSVGYGQIAECSVNAGITKLNSEMNRKQTNQEDLERTIYQNNLMYLENEFKDAFSKLRVNKNIFLFVDSVDMKLEDVSDSEYRKCIQGLATAIWLINTEIFRQMKGSKGFVKTILAIRTDMFSELNLHNQANKLRDNSVLLDWRTTYEDYRNSPIFTMCNNVLSYQNPGLQSDQYWDYYFPWSTYSTKPEKRDQDDSFINCLRLSLSRPRDMISIMKSIQDRADNNAEVTNVQWFQDNATQNAISNYFLDEDRDWCLYKFTDRAFQTLIFFFQFLGGKSRFSYNEYCDAFNSYLEQVDKRQLEIFTEVLEADTFLQLLYEMNMIYYIELSDKGVQFNRYCYREREIANLSPKVKLHSEYGVHGALKRALNIK